MAIHTFGAGTFRRGFLGLFAESVVTVRGAEFPLDLEKVDG